MKSDEIVGRTGVDLLFAYRWIILLSILILGAAVFVKVTDFSFDMAAVRPYLSIVMAPISGYFIGYLILTQLFETQYVVVKEIILDPRSCRTFLIPVKLFSEFNKSGNFSVFSLLKTQKLNLFHILFSPPFQFKKNGDEIGREHV